MVVYLARKLGWSRDEIGALSPLQFLQIYNELAYQESIDTWLRQHSVAVLLAAIYNTIPKQRGGKTFEAKDFYDVSYPVRGGKDKKVMAEVDSKASEAGIILPKK